MFNFVRKKVASPSGLTELNHKIITKACENTLDAYTWTYRRAFKMILDRNYFKAGEYLDDAFELIRANQHCGIFDSAIVRLRDDYGTAINYAKMLHRVDSCIQAGSYNLALQKYKEAGVYHDGKSVEKYNIVHQPLTKFVSGQENSAFILYCAEYYISRDLPNESLKLLKMLHQRGYPSEQTCLVQEKLAKKMAMQDIESGKVKKAKRRAGFYTGGDVWFSCFQKAYINLFSNK